MSIEQFQCLWVKGPASRFLQYRHNWTEDYTSPQSHCLHHSPSRVEQQSRSTLRFNFVTTANLMSLVEINWSCSSEDQNAFLYRRKPELNQHFLFGHLSVNYFPWQNPFQKYWEQCFWNIWTFYLFHKSVTKNICTSSINPWPHSFLTLSWLDSLGDCRAFFPIAFLPVFLGHPCIINGLDMYSLWAIRN